MAQGGAGQTDVLGSGRNQLMKKIIAAVILLLVFIPACAYAQDENISAYGLDGTIDKKTNTVTLSWNQNDECDGYTVYRRFGSEDEFICVCSLDGNGAFTYTEVLPQARTCYYKVTSYSGDSEAEPSEAVKIVSALFKPGKPSGLKAAGTDWNKVKLTWKKAGGATGYKVYRYDSSSEKYKLIKTTKKTSYTDSGLYPDTKYRYKVRAYVKKNGKTAYSAYTSSKAAYTLTSVGGLQLIRPLKNMTMGSGYGYRGGGFHIGADYAKPRGTPVYAAASGYVYRSRSGYGGLGNGIVINHSNGVVTWYGHLNSRCVSQGSYVKKGQKIGTVGHTGNAGSNHLHYEVWVNGYHYNPECFY